MFEAFKKIEYSGIKGDIVRIPNKERGEHVTDRTAGLIKALAGKHGWDKDKNGYITCNYFGLNPIKDKSAYSYTSSYTATNVGGGDYSVKGNKTYHGDFMALEIFVGSSEEVAKNKKSNVNRYLRAITWTPRSFGFWLLSIITSCVIVGLPLLVGCFYRAIMSAVAKSCVKKAKKSFKKNNKIIVF